MVVLLLHENAPAHRALTTQKKVVYLCFHCLDHPPYSPDLAPSDHHPFPELKKIENSPFFFRLGGHCCRGDLVEGQPSEFFFEWLEKVRATG
jgi:histone-lysine N-methyltransferase SETMAR